MDSLGLTWDGSDECFEAILEQPTDDTKVLIKSGKVFFGIHLQEIVQSKVVGN